MEKVLFPQAGFSTLCLQPDLDSSACTSLCHLHISCAAQLIPSEQEFESRKNAELCLSSENKHWVEIAFWDWLGISGYIGSFKS